MLRRNQNANKQDIQATEVGWLDHLVEVLRQFTLHQLTLDKQSIFSASTTIWIFCPSTPRNT